MTPGIGDTVTLRITDIAFGGEGVARTDEFVVFIPFTCVGDLVEATITEMHKRFARAQLQKVVESSADRVTAPCVYFGDCGGCQYQHLAYGAQLRAKHKQIRDLFQRVGNLPPDIVAPVIPCPKPYGYRNRIMIRSQWDKFKQGLSIGFIRHDNRLVVDIQECLISEPGLNEQIAHVRAHPPPKGGLKVVLRILPPGWEVPPDSFFQNNFALLPGMVRVVRDCLKAASTSHLLDLYCGVGFFSLELAGVVERFTGIELDRLAIQAARRNAANRGATNGEFIAGATEDMLPKVLDRFSPAKTTVLVDPPRKGCHPSMIELLRAHPPRQLIYVSCHPATMARDLNALCSDNVFTVSGVTPLDMFPQTAHVECVADVRHTGTRN